MSMIRKRSHSNTNVSKKEKPPQQESGTAHPALSRGDYSLGAAGTAGEGGLWGQVVMQMLRIVNVDCCSQCLHLSAFQPRNVIVAWVCVL